MAVSATASRSTSTNWTRSLPRKTIHGARLVTEVRRVPSSLPQEHGRRAIPEAWSRGKARR